MPAGQRSPHETICEIVAQLMWGPKTERQLDEAVLDERYVVEARLKRALHFLRESGVIRVGGYDERRCELWELQRTPFGQPDAEPPPGPLGKVRGRPASHSMGGRSITVAELAAMAGVCGETMRRRLRKLPPEKAVALGGPWTRIKSP